jgi:hypothetical protein
MLRPAADLIVIDPPGKLCAHGHGLNGYGRFCRRFLPRADAGPQETAVALISWA